MKLPPAILPLCQDLANAGGHAYIVGGWVRDLHLGLPSKDVDLEVFGLEQDRLLEILRRHGKAHAVGKSFGVLKLRIAGMELDIALPFDGQAPDPYLPLERAVLRRDLCCNALYYDPLNSETLDLTGGLEDLRQGILRAVSEQSLPQDPLRALRALRFACTKDMSLDPEISAQIRVTSLAEVAPERVLGELRKLLGSVDPAKGLSLLHSTKLGTQIFPAVDGQAAAARVAMVQPHLKLLAQAAHRESLLWALGSWTFPVPLSPWQPGASTRSMESHSIDGFRPCEMLWSPCRTANCAAWPTPCPCCYPSYCTTLFVQKIQLPGSFGRNAWGSRRGRCPPCWGAQTWGHWGYHLAQAWARS